MSFDYKIHPNLPSQFVLGFAHTVVCVFQNENCYLQFFVHIPLLKFMKESSAC